MALKIKELSRGVAQPRPDAAVVACEKISQAMDRGFKESRESMDKLKKSIDAVSLKVDNVSRQAALNTAEIGKRVSEAVSSRVPLSLDVQRDGNGRISSVIVRPK